MTVGHVNAEDIASLRVLFGRAAESLGQARESLEAAKQAVAAAECDLLKARLSVVRVGEV